jgi:hypothetical protein
MPDGSKVQIGLANQVRMWPAPDSAVSNDGEQPQTFAARQERQKAKGINGNGMGLPLAMAVQMWPPPTSRDHKDGATSLENTPVNALLGRAVLVWRTPAAADADRGAHPSPDVKAGEHSLTTQAAGFLSSRPAPEISTPGDPSSSARRSLNPLFVEWLMGWPPGWTSCACSATALSRWSRRMRSALSSLAISDAPEPAQQSLL